ncbi:MAG: ATP-binding protein [Anaerolineae bacterium]|nr:ATP-binding protein [Anaerolineae bacterium]
MQAVVLIGIQASGKSTFYAQNFFKSHIRLSLDMLRTRYREELLLNACLEAKQPFVIDNTNPTIEERAKYIVRARIHHFSVIGYAFQVDVQKALERNATRSGNERVPDIGVLGTVKRLQPPSFAEGFDFLYSVSVDDKGAFIIKEWPHEL